MLGIYRLTFTYIASAPALVIHAVKRNLFSRDRKVFYSSKYTVDFLFGFVVAILIYRSWC